MARLTRFMANSVAASIRLDARTLSNVSLNDLEALTQAELVTLRAVLDEATCKILGSASVPR